MIPVATCLLVGLSSAVYAQTTDLPIAAEFPADRCNRDHQFIDENFPDLCISYLAGMISVQGYLEDGRVIAINEVGSDSLLGFSVIAEDGYSDGSAIVDRNGSVVSVSDGTTPRDLDMLNTRPAVEYLIQKLSEYASSVR